MTLSNFLTEAAVNYKIGSGNPERMLYDFYVLSFISTINLAPEKTGTLSFGNIGFQGGFLGKSDRVKEDIEYAQDVLLPVEKTKLIKGLFVSICAEISHVEERNKSFAGTPLEKSKVFKYYIRNLTLMTKGLPKEFQITRVREPKAATPMRASYKISYQAATKAIKDAGSTPYEFVQLCEYAFKKMEWKPAYGGEAWANICSGYRLLVNSKSKDQVTVAIDHAYDLEHNTGAALNKVKNFYITDKYGNEDFTWMGKALDLKREATTMNKLIEKCSGDMKRLALQAMALSPIKYLKNKTPAPEVVMQQIARRAGGDSLRAFNQAAPEKYTTGNETPTVTPGYKTAAAPKDPPVAPFTFHKNSIYFDNFLKTYVEFIKPDPNSNLGMVVALEAITSETNISLLEYKIKAYNKEAGKLNTYIVMETDLVQVSAADTEALKDATSGKTISTPSIQSDKAYVHNLVPEAPEPAFGYGKVTNFVPEKIYYDKNTKAYVTYMPKSGWTDPKIVKLYAVTDNSNFSLLKNKIELFKKEFGAIKSYVAAVKDLVEIDKEDASLVKDIHLIAQPKDIPVNKPNLKVYIPFHKIGDTVFIDVNKKVTGEIVNLVFTDDEDFYKIKIIKNTNNSVYAEGLTYSKSAKFIDDLNPKYKVADRVIIVKSGEEGIIVQTPSNQDATSNYVIKITKTVDSKFFKKGEEVLVNSSDISPLKRENASDRTNAEKKLSTPGNIPMEAWNKMSDKVKKIFVPYKKDKNVSYVYFTDKDGYQLGLYGAIQDVKYSEYGNNVILSAVFKYYAGDSLGSQTTIFEKDFGNLQDFKSASETIENSPLFNAPSQNLSDAPALTQNDDPEVGQVYYHIPSQQYVKIKSSGSGVYAGKYHSIIPVAKTKFTPAYYTFNWAETTAVNKDLQKLSAKAIQYLSTSKGDFESVLPSTKTPEKLESHQKSILVHYVSNEDFLNLINPEALSSQSEIVRNGLYYDVTTRLVVKPFTSKKQFGDASKTLDVQPMEQILIDYVGDKKGDIGKLTVNKSITVYVTDLHRINDSK